MYSISMADMPIDEVLLIFLKRPDLIYRGKTKNYKS